MTPEQTTRLREPFGPEQVGLLPRITCKPCSDASGRCCAEHKKSKCGECGNYITERHMHLDYVGHGAVTDRLLDVDPEWSWEPLSFDQAGMPTFVYDQKSNPVSLWIKLTVGGVTRLGVGSCPSGQPDAEKVLIGDALRNAAMRFGVALDLWIKGHGEDDEQRTEGRQTGARASGPAPAPEETVPAASKAKLRRIQQLRDGLSVPALARLVAWAKAEGLPDPKFLTDPQADAVLAWLEAESKAEAIAEGDEPF